MKNDLLALKTNNVDSCLASPSNFMELVIASKFEDRELIDMLRLIADVSEREFYDEDEFSESVEEEFLCERLRDEMRMETTMDNEPDNSLYAGYVDCMDETIRFLVEEENISEEHPVIQNLKAHLENSKEKVLQTFSDCPVATGRTVLNADTFETNFPFHSIFTEAFLNSRGSC